MIAAARSAGLHVPEVRSRRRHYVARLLRPVLFTMPVWTDPLTAGVYAGAVWRKDGSAQAQSEPS